ncbi:Protein N-acetyltransferase, RimJ/RimL family [Oceanobacillus limi]|uniref:Protein N-acetyltransferase, RimJ/RimL family n=1 Tax=Oceanobacillus limi TaxID=930131 RepID=A0A1I0C5Q2_9BACI|nr:GNAT family N-acetyltransferase [Oceanobacillus limi]SET14422.1 Protein N-acetyltransferase, RimJ/RimL family [Oceanobacillus limi]
MIYEADLQVRKKLLPMYQGMEDTVIQSCLQGHMGTAWVDDLEKPTVSQLIVGIFVFYAGNPNANATEELLYNLPEHSLVIVDTEEWKKKIEMVHQDASNKIQRYRFRKERKDLDRHHLEKFLSTLEDGYELRKMDADIVREPSLHHVSEDFTAQFESLDDFINRGIGYAVLYKGQVVCGAASYSIYDAGIEIEIGTDPTHRRKGLATVAAAALILDCMDQGLYPSWDAANEESVKLAEKLGYVFEEDYDTYYIHLK